MTPKRIFDIIGAVLGLVVLSPAFAVIALALKCEGGPIVFRHQRLGQYGKPFALLKFRTMQADPERRGPPITIGNDPRVTRIGKYLRRTKLDETLQLVNVLRGEMSLVGPRPEVAAYVELENPTHQDVLKLQPGITDPASIQLWDEAELLASAPDPQEFYRRQLLPTKHQLSLSYAERATVKGDILILARTISGVIRACNRFS
jgi:lipopolysaccharide/colanic/teichoic acid biosynthesis glycosyltransferase